MGCSYKSTVSGPIGNADRLFITRCDDGHLQLVVTSGSQTGLICIDSDDAAEVAGEMLGYAQVPAAVVAAAV
jgi:hypothetical protein